VAKDLGTETKGTDTTIRILAYSDDIVLMGRTTGVRKEAVVNLSVATKEMGLTINLQKYTATVI
jgi:hypothetical protein